jgi:predicted O-methyltransferase YrrM
MKLGQIPAIGQIWRTAYRLCVRIAKRRHDEIAIRDLTASKLRSARSVAEALHEFSARREYENLARVEVERQRLLARLEPLEGGSLTAGPYDAGISVADACRVSAAVRTCNLLYLLVRQFKPTVILELGTNVGVSSAYQAMALRDNGGGKIVTFEASPYRLRIAQELHRRLDLHNVEYVQGLFAHTLPSALENLPPIDYAFIDGHHQYQPTLDYFGLIRRHASPDCLYIFDDIRWSNGMRQAWAEIQSDRLTGMAVDLFGIGLWMQGGTESSNRYISPVICLPIYA